jgi:hypothetical protein
VNVANGARCVPETRFRRNLRPGIVKADEAKEPSVKLTDDMRAGALSAAELALKLFRAARQLIGDDARSVPCAQTLVVSRSHQAEA